jgi:hypothetical protein
MRIGPIDRLSRQNLIFAGYSEMLNHLIDDVNRLGYTTCEIHGPIHPYESRR